MTAHSERSLLEALRGRYGPPEYALFTGVSNGTGGHSTRHADAVAMGVWPSRGLELLGFEVKIDRRDWLRERDNPAKADAVAKFCDRWWLVVADEALVKAGELPPTWGLLAPGPKGLRVVVEAPAMTPTPITRTFLAALLRRAASERPGEADLATAREAGRKQGRAQGMADAARQSSVDVEELARLRRVLHAFEEASGRSIIPEYVATEVGAQVREALAIVGAIKNLRRRAEALRDGLKGAILQVDAALAEPAHNTPPALDRAEGSG